MKEIISSKGNIYIKILFDQYSLEMGYCNFMLCNELFGDSDDLNYIDSSILGGVQALLNQPYISSEYSILSDIDLFNTFENILIDDGENFSSEKIEEIYQIRVKNWGTFLDDFDVYSYRVDEKNIKIIWKSRWKDKINVCIIDINYLNEILNSLRRKMEAVR